MPPPRPADPAPFRALPPLRRLLGGAAACLLVAAAPPPAGQALHPEWSPDGVWVAWYQEDGEDAHLQVAGPDGRPLQATRGPGRHAHPTWSPGSDRLGYTLRGAGDHPDLWILDLETGDRSRVTRTPGREAHPAWSPDGTRLAFVLLDGAGGSELWTVGVDGLAPRRLTDTPDRLELHPSWSPDGRHILYDTGGRERRWIEEVEVATGRRRALTDPDADGTATTPVRAPDGSLVAALYEAPGQGDLWRLGPGEARVRLTDLPGDAASPSPAPDGRNLAFQSNHEGGYAVYLLRLEDGEVVRLSEGEGVEGSGAVRGAGPPDRRRAGTARGRAPAAPTR